MGLLEGGERLLSQGASRPRGRPKGFWVGNTGLKRPGEATAASNTPLYGWVQRMTPEPQPPGFGVEGVTSSVPLGVSMGAEPHRGEGRPLEKQGAAVGPWRAVTGPAGQAAWPWLEQDTHRSHEGRTGQGDTHTRCFIYI